VRGGRDDVRCDHRAGADAAARDIRQAVMRSN
jgi:hypothetical protein